MTFLLLQEIYLLLFMSWNSAVKQEANETGLLSPCIVQIYSSKAEQLN